jgi:putative hydrolase of the HAD superfamily
MPTITAIGFDADDTLWESEISYVNTKEEFARLLSNYSSFEQVKAELDVIETQNVQLYGYGFKSFTLSMIETALQVSGGSVQASLIGQILERAKDVLKSEIKLIEGVEAVLSELHEQSPQYSLFLITKGELFEQQRKINRSGLRRYFQHTEVVPDKTPDAYARLLHMHNIPPEQFLMIGNSLRSDILPVISIQGWAVLVPHPLTWSHENTPGQEVPTGRWFEIQNIRELPGFLKRLDELVGGSPPKVS